MEFESFFANKCLLTFYLHHYCFILIVLPYIKLQIRGAAIQAADASSVTRICGRELSTLGGANGVAWDAALPTVCSKYNVIATTNILW